MNLPTKCPLTAEQLSAQMRWVRSHPSKKSAEASRRNGAKGGRPRKDKK